jgi:hypothetical protein
MSKSTRKNSSCLGLFVKSWLLSALLLGGAVAGTVGLGIKLLGWNAQSWTDFSAWTSPSVLALLGVATLSTLIAFAVASFIGLASAFLSKGSKSSASGSTRPAAPRPQSRRKTTV